MLSRIRELLYTALHDEGGESVEGAFVDEWISNSSVATDELEGLLPKEITSDLQAIFRELLLDTETDDDVAAKVLARLGGVRVEGFLNQLLADSEEKARCIGVRTAGYLALFDSLSGYLQDPSPLVRATTLQTIAQHSGRIHGSSALIQSAFDDADPLVRKTAYSVAGFKSMHELADRLWVENDLSALRAGLFRGAQELRREGVHYTGERLEQGLGPKMRVLLLDALEYEDAELRQAVASAMNRLRGQDVSDAMLARLQVETHPSVRAQICLFDGFEANAYPLLLALFTGDADDTVRTRCAFLLERFPAAAPALARAVAEADKVVWRAATMSLRRIGTKAELPALLTAAANPDSRSFSSELHRAIMDIAITDAYLAEQPKRTKSVEIQRWIDELHPDPVTEWHLAACKETFNALPIFSNVLYTWAIRPDGSVLRFDREAVGHRTEEETDPVVLFSTIAHGARTYPGLIELVPQPPKTIQLCRDCMGQGWVSGREYPHCSRCDGIGWTA